MQRIASIWITMSFIGFHQWKDAPHDVSYLSNLHRHKFGVKVRVPILSDREIEFHTLQQQIDKLLHNKSIINTDFPLPSCEGIASIIATQFMIESRQDPRRLSLPWIEVSIDEDGENGSTILLREESD